MEAIPLLLFSFVLIKGLKNEIQGDAGELERWKGLRKWGSVLGQARSDRERQDAHVRCSVCRTNGAK